MLPLQFEVLMVLLFVGGSAGSVRNLLWSDPKRIPYYVAVEYKDERIIEAIDWSISTWENLTCLEFYKLDKEPDATENYMRFENTTADSCIAFKENTTGPTVITIGTCFGGYTLGTVTAALGIENTQSRGDRNEYITIDVSHVPSNVVQYYDIDEDVLQIGTYDYNSIAQCNNDFPNLITAPVYVGQRVGPSAGDIAAVNFLYHNCVTPVEPTCILSKQPNSDGEFIITRNQLLFNLTAVGHYLLDSILDGAVFVNGNEVATLTGIAPFNFIFQWQMEYNVNTNNTYDITFSFTPRMTNSITCSLRVKIINEFYRCNGIVGKHDGCGGPSRGNCQPNGMCKCVSPYAGIECKGNIGCSENYIFHFDTEYGQGPRYGLIGNPISTSYASSMDPIYSGEGAMTFIGYGDYWIKAAQVVNKPKHFTTYIRRNSFEQINFFMKGKNNSISNCFAIHVYCQQFTNCLIHAVGVGGEKRLNVPLHGDRWYKFQLRFYYNSGDLKLCEVWVNNQMISTFVPACVASDLYLISYDAYPKGITYIDEATISCYEYMSLSGSITDLRRNMQVELQTGLVNHNLVVRLNEFPTDKIEINNCFVTSLRPSALAIFIEKELCGKGSIMPRETKISIPADPLYNPQVDDLVDISVELSNGITLMGNLRISGWCDQEISIYQNITFPSDTYVIVAADQQPYRPDKISFNKIVDYNVSRFQIILQNGSTERAISFQVTAGYPMIAFLPQNVSGNQVFGFGDLISVDITIDYEYHSVNVTVDSVLQISSLMYLKDDSFFTNSWGVTGIWVRKGSSNGFLVSCPQIPPVAATPLFVSTGNTFEISVSRGSSLLSISDVLFLHLNGDCSVSQFSATFFNMRKDRTHWTVGGLSSSGNYSICYLINNKTPSMNIGYIQITAETEVPKVTFVPTEVPTEKPTEVPIATEPPTKTPSTGTSVPQSESPSSTSIPTSYPTESPNGTHATQIPPTNIPTDGPSQQGTVSPGGTDVPASLSPSDQTSRAPTSQPSTPTPTTVPTSGGGADSDLPLWVIAAAVGGAWLLICIGIAWKRKSNNQSNALDTQLLNSDDYVEEFTIVPDDSVVAE